MPPSAGRQLRRRSARVVAVVLVIASLQGIARGAREVSVPATVAREIAVDVVDAFASLRDASVRAGVLRTNAAVASDAVSMCPGFHFTTVGLAWHQHGKAFLSADVRTGDSLRTLGAPTVVEDHTTYEGPDPGTPEYRPARRATDPLWVRDAQCATFTLHVPADQSISGLRAVFVNTSGTAETGPTAASASAEPIASGEFGSVSAFAASRPAIVTRTGWGADESLRNCGPYYSDKVKVAFVHHTAGSNNYTSGESDDVVRGILYYHTQVKGWCDIAYNFLVDKYGRVFEGRYGGMSSTVMPGAQMGFNTNTTAVSVLGNYDTAYPSSAMLRSINSLLAWKLDVHHRSPLGTGWLMSRGGSSNRFREGTWVQFRNITGHRDGNYTSCPGDHLYAKLRSIRNAAYSIGLPKIFNVKQSRDAFTPKVQTTRWAADGSTTMWWRITVYAKDGSVARRYGRWTRDLRMEWRGIKKSGRRLPLGKYTVKFSASVNGRTARPATFTVTLL